MRVKFLGCGDAFGSGGRFNTCFFVEGAETNFLIDCGASAMISMRTFGVDPNNVEAIILSHLHADHFGGLPFFILDAQVVSQRRRPLYIAGPVGLRDRLDALMEAHFPGSSKIERKFPTYLVEMTPEVSARIGSESLKATGYVVAHPSGTPSHALRIQCDGKTLGFSGDTEWVDTLLKVSNDADLFISECYTFDQDVRFHLNYKTLNEKISLLNAKKIVLTHMSSGMLSRTNEVVESIAVAYDGLEIAI